jgi:hypothetical protein
MIENQWLVSGDPAKMLMFMHGEWFKAVGKYEDTWIDRKLLLFRRALAQWPESIMLASEQPRIAT